MTPDQHRAYAEELMLEHAKEVERLTIHEVAEESVHVPGDEISEDDARAVHDLIQAATVTITWPDAGPPPVDLAEQQRLLRNALAVLDARQRLGLAVDDTLVDRMRTAADHHDDPDIGCLAEAGECFAVQQARTVLDSEANR